jgi:hypothetical protein
VANAIARRSARHPGFLGYRAVQLHHVAVMDLVDLGGASDRIGNKVPIFISSRPRCVPAAAVLGRTLIAGRIRANSDFVTKLLRFLSRRLDGELGKPSIVNRRSMPSIL